MPGGGDQSVAQHSALGYSSLFAPPSSGVPSLGAFLRFAQTMWRFPSLLPPSRGRVGANLTITPVIIDLCCSPYSGIGRLTTAECRVARIIETDDSRRTTGRKTINHVIVAAPPGHTSSRLGFIPLKAGGGAWQESIVGATVWGRQEQTSKPIGAS